MTPALNFEGWTPIRLIRKDSGFWVDWCRFGGRRFTEPFFEDSVTLALQSPFNLAFRQETPIEQMLEWARTRPGIAPTVFIFHASRCGSTLLAQMLAALNHYIVVSEAPMIDALLRLRHTRPDISEDTHIEWIRALLSALAQPLHGERHFAVKFDAWNILEFELLRRAFPETPCIYLYRDPAEIGASQMAMRGSYMVPGRLDPSPFGFDLMESIAWPPEEYIARVLGRMFEAGRAVCSGAKVMPVHYCELPDLAWTTLRPALGLADHPADIETMSKAARRDAKNPQLEFAPGEARKPREVSDALRAQIEQWTTPAYRQLEALRQVRVGPRDM